LKQINIIPDLAVTLITLISVNPIDVAVAKTEICPWTTIPSYNSESTMTYSIQLSIIENRVGDLNGIVDV
jgi:hypothetical protein